MHSLRKKIEQLHVLVIGDVMLDTYAWGVVERKSPEAPVDILRVLQKTYRAGGAANVALNLRSLGVSVSLAGITGTDASANRLSEILNESKVGAACLMCCDGRITTEKQRLIDGSRHLLRSDYETTEELNEPDTNRFLKLITEQIERCHFNAVILQDYNKGVFNKYVIERLLALCRSKGIPVSVDPKKNHFFEYTGVHLFKPNWKETIEALQLWDNTNADAINAADAAAQLLAKLEAENVLITLSAKGMYYKSISAEHGHIPVRSSNVIDVSGAGDTVIATCTAALAAGCTLKEAADLANIAASIVCEEAGVVTVNADRLFNS